MQIDIAKANTKAYLSDKFDEVTIKVNSLKNLKFQK